MQLGKRGNGNIKFILILDVNKDIMTGYETSYNIKRSKTKNNQVVRDVSITNVFKTHVLLYVIYCFSDCSLPRLVVSIFDGVFNSISCIPFCL